MRRLLNTRVGRSNKQEHEWHGILRNFETSIRNENGLLFLEFCAIRYPKKLQYICRAWQCNKNIDCYVDTTAKCWTDHQMIILYQKWKIKWTENLNVTSFQVAMRTSNSSQRDWQGMLVLEISSNLEPAKTTKAKTLLLVSRKHTLQWNHQWMQKLLSRIPVY